MCLSTVYKNEMAENAIVMKNVMQIQCKDGCVILTDLMDREVSIEGVLETANLVVGDIYGKPAIVTDTHFIRLCNRIGFSHKR